MFDHLLSDYRLFFEGMPAPVFYKSLIASEKLV